MAGSSSSSRSQSPENYSPYIRIIEQPASKALRFRYKCEGRSAGSIPGVSSTAENKTYPTIQIVGYQGRAVVVVSCVTKDEPYRPHPHNLVGRENCRRGVCTIEIDNEFMTASFQNLGIQCVKRREIDTVLTMRKELRVDPFRTGFQHKDNPNSIDLNAVRLCFQVFLGCADQGKYKILEPVVSDPIYDKKAMSDLVISRLSDTSASVVGGREIILLCEKVVRDDIQVRFFEEKNGRCVWEGYADFQQSDVHKQVAIHFKTPRYHTTRINNAVNVWIQLKRPSDGMSSESRRFKFTPVESGASTDGQPEQKIEENWADDQFDEKVPLSVFDNGNNEMEIVIKDEPIEIKEEVDEFDEIKKEDEENTSSSSSETMGEDLHDSYSNLQMDFNNPYSENTENDQSSEDNISIMPSQPPNSSTPKIGSYNTPHLPLKRLKKNPRPIKYLPTEQEIPSKQSTNKLLKMPKRNKSMSSFDSNISDPMNDTPLTEAANYDLYTSVAPHTTIPEFGESSGYYSTVEGGTVTTVK